jgi:hypothetical protein
MPANVMFEEGDIFGDGVNIAASLAAELPPATLMLPPPRWRPESGYAQRHGSKDRLERAFEPARSRRVAGLTDRITKRDGYSARQIEGPFLKRQLADLIKAARGGTSSNRRERLSGLRLFGAR